MSERRHRDNGVKDSDIVITGMGCCIAGATSPRKLVDQVRGDGDALGLARSVSIPADLGGGADEWMVSVDEQSLSSISGLRRPLPDRPTLMAIAATDQALAHACLDARFAGETAVGLVLSTCFGPSETVENFLRILLARGPANVSAIAFSRAVSNAMVGEISRRHHLRGPSSTVLGSSALAYAVDLLTDMRASAIVCVGVDEVRDLHLWAYRRAGLLAGGMVLGEGAAALVLERRDSAVARGAPIAASVLGSAMGFCPTSVHRITDVTGESLGECLLAALERASRSRADLDCVVAAASGHADLIDAEHRAVRSALGFDPVWLAPKRVFGESFGASEAIGVIVGVGALLESAEVESAVRLCAVNACQVGGGVSSIILGCGS